MFLQCMMKTLITTGVCKQKGFSTKSSAEEETEGGKQEAYEPGGNTTGKEDKANNVPQ